MAEPLLQLAADMAGELAARVENAPFCRGVSRSGFHNAKPGILVDTASRLSPPGLMVHRMCE